MSVGVICKKFGRVLVVGGVWINLSCGREGDKPPTVDVSESNKKGSC